MLVIPRCDLPLVGVGMSEEQCVVIETSLGKLRGGTKKSVLSEKRYYAFQGIPFGKPPLGKLRFKAPEAFGGWEGIRDALEDGNEAKQPDILSQDKQKTLGDEDCLYLNVYMNQLPDSSRPLKPVMVSIHSGGFLLGSGRLKFVGPDLLLEEDIVIVSFNYRCGAFGFLSLETEEAPGNAGLKDQTLALRWVQDNIRSFGGDPDNVTIFGMSAGGASVHYQLLCPPSGGLFHKAIAQSGFASNPWAIQQNPKSVAKELAKALGCTADDPAELLSFLQSVPADDIVLATNDLINKRKGYVDELTFVFTPSVEIPGAECSLPDTPYNLMKTGRFHRVPVILGVTSNEALYFPSFNKRTTEDIDRLSKSPELLVPSFLGIEPGSSDEKEVTKAIQDVYFKGKPLNLGNLISYLQYVSDCQFNIGMELARSCLTKHSSSPVYSYVYSNHTMCFCQAFSSLFASEENVIKVPISDTEACHGADSQSIYVMNAMPAIEYTPDRKKVSRKHVNVWTAFASLGDPNLNVFGVSWRKDSASNPCFMDIGKDWAMKDGIPFADRMGLWRSLGSKYCAEIL